MIRDKRDSKQFKQKTFSGYKKSDVRQALCKSLDSKNVESSCNWLLECLLSGYIRETWEYICLYYCQFVHVNNPELLRYIHQKHKLVQQMCHGLSMDQCIELRNNQTLLQCMISTIVCMIQTSINVKYSLPKIKREDFQLANLQMKLHSQMNILPDNIVRFNEPPELKLVMNEIYYHLQSKLNAFDKISYWIYWILEWERINRKNKIAWNLQMRQVDVPDRYKSDVIWILWDTVQTYVNKQTKQLKQDFQILYTMYCDQFDRSKRKKRIPYLLNIISLCTTKQKLIPLYKKLPELIQSQCNYYSIIESKKIYEQLSDTNIESTIKKNKIQQLPKKSKINIIEEQTKQKLEDFNEIDRMFFNA